MDTRHHEYKHSATAPHHYLYFEEELKKHGPEALDPAKGYYSYELDGWQIIVLNSNLCADKKVRNRYGNGCTEQLQWLEMELANIEEGSCTLAYFHHPAFTSGGKPEKEKRAMCPIFKNCMTIEPGFPFWPWHGHRIHPRCAEYHVFSR